MSEERTQLWGLKILIEAVRVANQQNIYTPESVELIKEAIGLFVQPVPQEEAGQPDANDDPVAENETSDTPTSDESADTEE